MTIAILLAAGRAERMGVPKLLLPIHGMPLLARVAAAFPPNLVKQLLIVVRPGLEPWRGIIQAAHAQWVENPLADQGGMLGSVRCGLRALPPETRTAIICPADMPGLDASLISFMLAAWRSSAQTIMVPVYAEKRGHPLILSTQFVPEILERFDGVGLRGLLQAHADKLIEWPAPSPVVLQDLDTPEDWQLWSRAYKP